MRTALAILLLGATASAQQPRSAAPAPAPPATQESPDPQQPRPPLIRRGVNFVSVDVIVTEAKTGAIVLDLNKEDFEIREDRKPQRVDTFEVMEIDAAAEAATPPRQIRSLEEEEREATLPNVRLFVILLDDYHVRRGNDLVVRKPLLDFVENQLGPQDMVAIMYPLTPVTALTFTRDRASLVRAIANFEGRKGIYEPRNEIEARHRQYSAARIEAIREDITIGALKGAAIRLGGLREGRKSIVFVSEGLKATNFFGEVDLMNRLRDVAETCNRHNTSIYALDPRGLAVFENGIEQAFDLETDRRSLTQSIETLKFLGEETNGRAIVNRNDLTAGMKQIMRDSSGYYLIGYSSSAAPADGKFHSIDVHVKRPGVDVRARPGYWAYTVDDVARATAAPAEGPPAAVLRALDAIAESATAGPPARFWVGTDRGQNGQSRLTVVWEPVGESQGDRRASDSPARVRLTATSQDGRPIFRGRAPEDNSAARSTGPATPFPPAAAPTRLSESTSFDVPPGPLELRIVVESQRGEIVDSSTRTVTIPDYQRTTLAIATPKVFRARTAGEFARARANPRALPTAGRGFSRTDRLLIRFDAYAAGGMNPEVRAKLLNRAGQPLTEIPVQSTPGQPFQIDFALAPLAAGQYILEIDAKSPAGAAQQMIGFKVGS